MAPRNNSKKKVKKSSRVVYNGPDGSIEALNVSDSDCENDNVGENCEINRLNDDCLIDIFLWLPIKERMRLQNICNKWHDVVELSWSRYNKLTLLDLLLQEKFFQRNKANLDSNQVFYKFLSKCGKFLRTVDIGLGNTYLEKYKINPSLIIYYLSLYCFNIINLKISGEKLTECDIHFGLLFAKNKDLKCVKILWAQINGNCLLQLPCDTLEELFLADVSILSPTIPDFSVHLKNLKTMKVSIKNSQDVTQISQEIYDPQKILSIIAPNICNLLYINNSLKPVMNLAKLLSEAKNLKILMIGNIQIKREMLLILPANSLETFILFNSQISSEDIIYCSKNFNKLTEFGLERIDGFENLTLELTENKNFKYFSFRFNSFSNISSTKIHKLFESFKKLEILQLSKTDIDDHSLAIISLHCKSLTAINLNNCKNISDSGLNFITTLPKLEVLVISGSENVTDSSIKCIPNIKKLKCSNCSKLKSEGLCNLLSTSPRLEELDISNCESIIVEDIIDAAKETINFRGKGVTLKIFILCKKILFQSYIKRSSSFPNLHLIFRAMDQSEMFYPFKTFF